MAELGLDRLLARQQAELGAVETGTQQRIDGGLQPVGIVEIANGFRQRSGFVSVRHAIFLVPA